ncbi:MAG TPA: cyclase family protein [Longilinea sp.]|nr:cyclase family protein [Longilinea sp.]
MTIYDITLTITPDLPVWPGDLKVKLERVKKMEEGAQDNLSQMALGVHTGTHVDAPFHFIPEGIKIDELSLEILTGPAQVVVLPDSVDLITAEIVRSAGIMPRTTRVLFKTRNSKRWIDGSKEFDTKFVAISPDGAEALVALGMKLVGVDYLSVSPFGDSVPTHRALLGAGIICLEGANLSTVPSGVYTLYCLPMKLGATEGAPARAILVQ